MLQKIYHLPFLLYNTEPSLARKRKEQLACFSVLTKPNMYCPQCGQERASEATSFCSRCGFLLTAAAELLHTGGVPPHAPNASSSPRARGLKQGLFIFQLTFLLAPIVGLISVFGLRMEPWPVGVVVFLLGVGGLLRMVYAVMFEPSSTTALAEGSGMGSAEPLLGGRTSDQALPPPSFVPAAAHGRLDTSDLEPASVTEGTTKLLDKDP